MCRFIIMLAFLLTLLNAKEYILDPAKSEVDFKIRHLQVSSVSGKFSKIWAKFNYDEDFHYFKTFKARISVKSLDTHNNLRDTTLMSEQYFHLKSHPFIYFNMQRYEKLDLTTGVMYGTLSICGVSKNVKFELSLKDHENGLLSIKLKSMITRTQFTFAPHASELLLGNKIFLKASLEAKQALKG